MAPREGEKQSRAAPGPAASGNAEEDSSREDRTEEMVAQDVDANSLFQDEEEDDDVIQNLNKMGRMKLFSPEFIENAKKDHREHIAFLMEVHDEMVEARRAAAAAESSKA